MVSQRSAREKGLLERMQEGGRDQDCLHQLHTAQRFSSRGEMRCLLLCRLPSSETLPVRHFGGFLLRITDSDFRDSISLSLALNCPDRSFGGTTDSKASSFTDGSARV